MSEPRRDRWTTARAEVDDRGRREDPVTDLGQGRRREALVDLSEGQAHDCLVVLGPAVVRSDCSSLAWIFLDGAKLRVAQTHQKNAGTGRGICALVHNRPGNTYRS